MNWSRGLFRLWLIFSVIWIVLIGLISNPIGQIQSYQEHISKQHSMQKREAKVKSDLLSENQNSKVAELQRVLVKVTKSLAAKENAAAESDLQRIESMLVLALGAPIATLIFGLLIRWALRGFRQQDI